MPTGDIEVKAQELTILNRCPTPPFEITEFPGEELANEDLRMQYRYLDLRRGSIQRTLMLRHRVCKVIRDFLDAQGFLELETPLLGRSTPEGARDYLVPSRVFPGQWYALPQSPQIYKQLLMVAGYDKYFQIARCLRDEDLRADRQPEFTQLDLEMSFVEMDDIFRVIEGLTAAVFQAVHRRRHQAAAAATQVCRRHAALRQRQTRPALSAWKSSMSATWRRRPSFRFSRAPSRRAARCGHQRQGSVEKFTRKQIDELPEFVKRYGAKGWPGSRSKPRSSPRRSRSSCPPPSQQALRQRLNAAAGRLAAVRRRQGRHGLPGPGQPADPSGDDAQALRPHAQPDYKIAWVYDFPSFIWDDEEKRWAANHHPFTAPMDEDLAKLETDPGSVRAKAYDLVINGYECGGGSIRIHNPDVQSRLFAALGMTPGTSQDSASASCSTP